MEWRRIPGVRVEQRHHELVLHRSRRQLLIGCFFLFWLAGWSMGCLFLAAQVVAEPTFFHIAFALPFWGAWLIVASLLIFMLFGRERLRLARDGVYYRRSALITLSHRYIPWDALQNITLETETHRVNRTMRLTGCLQLVAADQTIRFGRGLSLEQARDLLDQVEDYLAVEVSSYRSARRKDVVGEAESDWATDDRSALSQDDFSDAATPGEILRPTTEQLAPPADSDCTFESEWDHVRLVRRTRLRLIEVLPVVVFAAFWNGFILFVINLVGNKFDATLALVVGGFGLVGLWIAGTALVLLFRPLWKATWSFHRHEIVARAGLFGLGRSHSYDVIDLKHLELRESRSFLARRLALVFASVASQKGLDRSDFDEAQKQLAEKHAQQQHGRIHTLAFVRRNGSYLLTIPKLTEADARWVAQEIYGERDAWFR